MAGEGCGFLGWDYTGIFRVSLYSRESQRTLVPLLTLLERNYNCYWEHSLDFWNILLPSLLEISVILFEIYISIRHDFVLC